MLLLLWQDTQQRPSSQTPAGLQRPGAGPPSELPLRAHPSPDPNLPVHLLILPLEFTHESSYQKNPRGSNRVGEDVRKL